MDSVKVDWPTRLVAEARLRPRRVLEVGAANGYRLERFRRTFGCEAFGVEPSSKAVAASSRVFPEIQLTCGVAHDLSDFEDGLFDLVIVNFVLHWVDRSVFFRTAAEIDRVLADGGHVVIGDFAPDKPQRVRYHHRPETEVYTYKQDYPAFWLASGAYKSISEILVDHRSNEPSTDIACGHRTRVALLEKVGASGYQTVTLA